MGVSGERRSFRTLRRPIWSSSGPRKNDLKKKIFVDLDNVCPAHAITGHQYFSLVVIEIGTATRRPEKVAACISSTRSPS
jgi:hypothetical protein